MDGGARWWATAQRRWPWLTDVAILGFLELDTIADWVQHRFPWWAWLLAQALIMPLLLRRRHPLAVFTVIAALVVVQDLTRVHLTAAYALLVAVYTIGTHGRDRFRAASAVLVESVVVVASIQLRPLGGSLVGSLVFLNSIVAAAFFLGTTVRNRRRYQISLEDRARRAELERDQQAQLAAVAERTRIAREMHDVIAHSLSVVIRLADAAVAVNGTDHGEANTAMEQVATTSRQALTEVRRLLGVLREPTPSGAPPVIDLAPLPRLDQLEKLLDDIRATGLPIRLVTTGTPPQLLDTAEATIFRLVQESVTNVIKHAVHATHVDVELCWQPDEVGITVRDDGVPRAVGTTPGGHGLRGMVERVTLYDGSLTWGPAWPRGWELRATMRLDRAAA
ncbi:MULTISPECIES: sensor histidine kinase [Pseudofrankia]|uniref:sensor histidine kinase n=1 Tax=Pseudofrankia TaxID=2994363 RepID=UPI000234CA18|nr:MULTISPECIES: sensor histidine kinase [Pseudofrankia]OHV33198.1 hypothetical protein BCD49_27545 [Pseudofrankia sp. EUN1h]